jgi:hypothetical protein
MFTTQKLESSNPLARLARQPEPMALLRLFGTNQVSREVPDGSQNRTEAMPKSRQLVALTRLEHSEFLLAQLLREPSTKIWLRQL